MGLYDFFLDFAINLAKEAGEMSVNLLEKNDIRVEYKGEYKSIITSIDLIIEEFIVSNINNNYNSHQVMSEENYSKVNVGEGYCWVIDPVDGTNNLYRQKINYTISIALFKDMKPVLGIVYDPTRKELFYAEKGQGAFLNGKKIYRDEIFTNQTIGSLNWKSNKPPFKNPVKISGYRFYDCASLEMSYVACGRLDFYICNQLNPWDFAAAWLICLEANCIVGSFTGQVNIQKPQSIFTVTKEFYKEIENKLN